MFIDNEYNIIGIFRCISIVVFIFGILIPIFLWARWYSMEKYKKAEKCKIIFLTIWSFILTIYFIATYWNKGIYELLNNWTIWIVLPIIVYYNTVFSIYKYCITRKKEKEDEGN